MRLDVVPRGAGGEETLARERGDGDAVGGGSKGTFGVGEAARDWVGNYVGVWGGGGRPGGDVVAFVVAVAVVIVGHGNVEGDACCFTVVGEVVSDGGHEVGGGVFHGSRFHGFAIVSGRVTFTRWLGGQASRRRGGSEDFVLC